MKSQATILATLALGLVSMPTMAQEGPPESLELTGVVHDFIERTKTGGHTDFEVVPAGGYAHYMNNVAMDLDAEGRPYFVGGGRKVASQWKNSAGKPIHPSLYNGSLGDTAGSYTGGVDKGGIASAASFAQWFQDVPGVNMSQPMSLTLARSGGTEERPIYTYQNNSFFPIDHQLYGNSGGSPDHNFHFTFELHTEFTYDMNADQVFSFYGDDDVWVFINGRMVIDIGGVHSKVQQLVELNRLGLTNGHVYTLDFYFAERHRTESNFRIDTTLLLETSLVPSVAAAYD